LFETKCSQCHAAKLPDEAAVKTAEDARELVTRMVGNGLSATDTELETLTAYIVHMSVK
jgi:hypothetical protein